jgi:hypothetical protein
LTETSSAFREKALFIWNDSTIGTAEQIVEMLKTANFEGAYLHETNLTSWRKSSRAALVNALKAAGIRVYASAAVYGYDPEAEGQRAAALVEEYNLDGMVFDIESGQYETSSEAPSLVVKLLKAYKAGTRRPCAMCWWPFFEDPYDGVPQYHPVSVLKEGMKYADVGMPMAYWDGGDTPAAAVKYLNNAWKQWREVTDKPLVIAGRAYNDKYATARGDAVTAYDARVRELRSQGAVGISWWDMDKAVHIPDVWEALKATPKWLTDQPNEPEEPVANPYQLLAMGQYVQDDTWANDKLAFIIGDAGSYLTGPNPRLKPIETKAAAWGQHFIALWDLKISYYEEQQYNPNDQYWPAEDRDEVLKAFKKALVNRSPRAVIVRVMDDKMANGKPHAPGYLNYAARKFCERASDWLWKTKKIVMLVQSSHEYMTENAPDMVNWVGYWDSVIEQYVTTTTQLDQSYPKADDKPRYYLGVHPDWDLWFYFNGVTTDLYLFNGDRLKLANFLGASVPDPDPVDTTPPSKPEGLSALVNGSAVSLAWQPSTDDTGVTGYFVIRDGVQVGAPAGTNFTETGLAPGMYTYAVRAHDDGTNLSPLSDPLIVTIVDDSTRPVDLSAVLAALARIETAQAAQTQVIDQIAGEVSEIRAHFKP